MLGSNSAVFHSDQVFGYSKSITLNLGSFTVTQDGFGAGFGNEDEDVDKAGVSLPRQHPGCLGQIIQACEQTTGQGFVLLPGWGSSCTVFGFQRENHRTVTSWTHSDQQEVEKIQKPHDSGGNGKVTRKQIASLPRLSCPMWLKDKKELLIWHKINFNSVKSKGGN